MKKNPVNWSLILLLILTFIMLFAPHLARAKYVDGLLIGQDSYYSLRIAENIQDTLAIPTFDELSYGGRPLILEPGWPLLLSFSPLLLSKVLPLILGLISIFLFYNLTRKFNKDLRFYSSIFLIISPAFIYLFSISNKYAPAITLSLLGILLFQQNKYFQGFLSFAIIPLFSIAVSIFILLLLFIMALKRYIHRKWFFYTLFISLVLFTLLYNKFFTYGLPQIIWKPFSINLIFNSLISDLGGKFGVGIFSAILSLVGIYFVWEKKHKYFLVYLIALLLVIVSYYLPFTLFFFNFLIALLTASTFLVLLRIDWGSDTLKQLTIIILVCGLIFSAVAYERSTVMFEPSFQEASVANFLKNIPGNEVVFSHISRGHWISYSGKKNVMDTKISYAPGYNQRLEDSNALFHAKSLKDAEKVIKKYKIKYIWLDKEIKSKLWDRDGQELLFLLDLSPKFKKIYERRDVEIWEYNDI